MAKIILNNKEFNIDDAVIASIINELKTHLSTIMVGSGATIILDGTSYNIDSTKLLTATNNFVSHLGTIAGSGEKIVINGIEYAVDSVKIADITSDLDSALGVLEGLELLTSPTIDITDTTLNIYDEEGLATSYDILVDGEVKASVNKVSLISFTIDGTSYQAEEGMTWGDWQASTYNTGGYLDQNGFIGRDANNLVCRSDGAAVTTAGEIEANSTYIISAGGLP